MSIIAKYSRLFGEYYGKIGRADLGQAMLDILGEQESHIARLEQQVTTLLNHKPHYMIASWDTVPLSDNYGSDAWVPLRFTNEVLHGNDVRNITIASVERTRFEPQHAGDYLIIVALFGEHTSTPANSHLAIFKNGGMHRIISSQRNDSSSLTGLNGSEVVAAMLGDKFDIRVKFDTDGAQGWIYKIAYMTIAWQGYKHDIELNGTYNIGI